MLKKIFSLYHYLWALLGSVIYGHPSRKITLIGVTGTKGKSTTVELIGYLLKENGFRVATLGSAAKRIGDQIFPGPKNTMPGRSQIQKFLKEALAAGCTHAVIEVSSQGVEQYRDRFLDWDIGVFLNISPEHIEAHGSFENYKAAKLRFFKTVTESSKAKKYLVVNMEDAARGEFRNQAGVGVEAVDFYPNKFAIEHQDWKGNWIGTGFNLWNAAAAEVVGKIFGLKNLETLKNFPGVRGRFEIVQREPFFVVVDYAHTPNSLGALYKEVKENWLKSGGKIIGVLGSASGGRDVWKRPEMGKIAAQFCELVIITNEDPFDENPESIMEQVAGGCVMGGENKLKEVRKILDRREAIRAALLAAQPGDAVVLSGKGSESSIRVAGGKNIPWNERQVVEEILANSEK
jgi:UDP-N-acetylmuramoyl-L-alanyl-D-glutamate--2,6-diaminopimelate ligase